LSRERVAVGLMDYLSAAMVDSARAGLIAVDEAGRVVAFNPLGAAYLLARGGFRERNGRLTTTAVPQTSGWYEFQLSGFRAGRFALGA